MHVKTLHIENFRGIRNMELELHPRMNVLIGVNGAGKSSVLDALATSLSWWEAMWSSTNVRRWQGEPLMPLDITNDTERASCTVQLNFEDYPEEEPSWTISQIRGEPAPSNVTLNSATEFKLLWDTYRKLNSKSYTPPPVLYYPIDRTEKYFRNYSEIPNSTLQEILSKRVPAFETLGLLFSPYSERVSFIASLGVHNNYSEFLDWINGLQKEENLKLRELQELGHDVSDPNSYQSPILIAIKRAWSKLSSNTLTHFIIKEHQYSLGNSLYLSCRKGGLEITDAQFSGGEKMLLALIGSLAQNYCRNYTPFDDELDQHGIVLIDEIDLHLHPQWQRMILPKLMEIFPNTQFIVTTHSPQVVGEMRSENVFILSEGENGIEAGHPAYEIYGQTSGILLEDMMQTPERNGRIQTKIKDAFDALELGNIDDAKRLICQLREEAAGIPDLRQLEMRLSRKEIVGK